MGFKDRVVEISGLGVTVLPKAEIADVHLLSKRGNLWAVRVVTEIDMDSVFVRIHHIFAGVDGFIKELCRLIMSGDEHVHLRVIRSRDHRELWQSGPGIVPVQLEGFHCARKLCDKQNNANG